MGKPKNQQIRVQGHQGKYEFSGWLTGRSSYLRVRMFGRYEADWIEGYALYRLAKAIVRHYEADKRKP